MTRRRLLLTGCLLMFLAASLFCFSVYEAPIHGFGRFPESLWERLRRLVGW